MRVNLTVHLRNRNLVDPFRDYDRSDLYATIVACYADENLWTPWQYITAVSLDLGARDMVGLRDFPITLNTNTNYFRLGLCESMVFISHQPVALDRFDQDVEGWEGLYRVTHPLVLGRKLNVSDQDAYLVMRYFQVERFS